MMSLDQHGFSTRSQIEPKETSMRKIVSVILLWMAVLPALAQSPAPKYQPGTIMAVKPHKGTAAGDPSTTRFDISIRVGSTLYTVLYAPPPGSYGAEYTQGMNLLVLVGDKTITFSDMTGVSRQAAILSRAAVSPQSDH
jgi:hypothetical protein